MFKVRTLKRLTAGLFVLAPAAIFTIQATMVYSPTDSVAPYHLFRIAPRKPAAAAVGDFIRVRKEIPGFGRLTLVKQIRCTEGMELTSTAAEYRCNGVKICDRKVIDQAGSPLPTIAFNGRIPKGMCFVTGTGNHSYDSRIWGLLAMNQIKDVVIPIERVLCCL